MANLCHILHHKSEGVVSRPEDWLQKVVVVADKYCCAEKLRDYVHFKLLLDDHATFSSGPPHTVSVPDRFMLLHHVYGANIPLDSVS